MNIYLSAIGITLAIVVVIWIFRDIIVELLFACVIGFFILDITNKDIPKDKAQIIYISNDSIPEKEYWIEKLKKADNPDSILFYKQKILLEEFNSKQ